MKKKFLQVLMHAKSAICCRLTPKQKAQITGILKKEGKKVVLCVGDGTNDVSMIQESSIGVGIVGREGSQVRFFNGRLYVQATLLYVSSSF